MPNAAPAAGTGTPVSGDHSSAMELHAPVVEEESTDTSGDPNDLGSHREDETAPEQTEGEEATSTDVELPARLKGKSLPEIVKEFEGLEKEYSRQGNELGEARGLLRQALQQGLTQPGAEKTSDDEPEPTDDEMIANPKDSVRKLVDKAVKPLQKALTAAQQQQMVTEFNARHPGYQQEARTQEFQDFVKASPYRTRLFNAAAGYDMDAAEDLFNAWAEVKAAKQPAAAGETKREAIRRTTTETGGAGKTASGGSGKKIYKSTELMRLYQTDRQQYNDILRNDPKMFAEKRVR